MKGHARAHSFYKIVEKWIIEDVSAYCTYADNTNGAANNNSGFYISFGEAF